MKTVWIILSQPATKVALLERTSVWAMAGRKLSVVLIGADCNEKSAADTMTGRGGRAERVRQMTSATICRLLLLPRCTVMSLLGILTEYFTRLYHP